MSNRYADNIRRIVGIDTTNNAIGKASVKTSIPGRRGVGTATDSGAVGTSQSANNGGTEPAGVSGTPGTDGNDSSTPSSSPVFSGVTGTAYAEPGTQASDPSTGMGKIPTFDPGTSTTGNGTHTADEIFAGSVAASKVAHPQTTADGLQYDNDAPLNYLLARDPDTLRPLRIILKGDFVPPVGWSDAETPPNPDPSYLSANMWSCGLTGNSCGSTTVGYSEDVWGIIAQAIAYYECADPSSGPWSYRAVTQTDTTATGYLVSSIETSPGSGVIYELALSSTRASCTPGSPPECTVSYTYDGNRTWPIDNEMQIKYDNGHFITNDRDTDRTTGFLGDLGQVNFTFYDDFDRSGELVPTKDGGFMLYELIGGDPAAPVRVYDSNARMINSVGPSQLTSYLPPS